MLADDHAVVRRGLELLLNDEDDFEVVKSVGTIEATIRTSRAYKPDVLVAELHLPDGASADAIPRILEASPGTHIVILTTHSDLQSVRDALAAGATGYALKAAAREELVEAVRRAAAGLTYLNPQLGARVAAQPPAPRSNGDGLSPRELEVLRRLALGHTNAEIAQQLRLSARTVDSHRARIQQKLLTSTRAELVRYALDHRLLEI